MNRVIALVAVIAPVWSARRAGARSQAESALHLDPRSDDVVVVDLNYESGNWKQMKRLYAMRSKGGSFERRAGFEAPRRRDWALAMTRRDVLSSPTTSSHCSEAPCRSACRTEPARAPAFGERPRPARAGRTPSATRAWKTRTARCTSTSTASGWMTRAVEAAYEESATRPRSATGRAVYRGGARTARSNACSASCANKGSSPSRSRASTARGGLGGGVGLLGGDTIVAR